MMLNDPLKPLSAFKAYDVRGRVPMELDEWMAYCIGRAYAQIIAPQGAVAVGYDIRHSSLMLKNALIAGLNEESVPVVDIGLCGTEYIYFAASQRGFGGGIMVTASHNPQDYNGFKMVKEESRPIGADTGLLAIEARTRELMLQDEIKPAYSPIDTLYRQADLTDDYLQKILSFVDVDAIQELHVVINSGHGCAGPTFDALMEFLPISVSRLYHQPDGAFPAGVPNPMVIAQQEATAKAVRRESADFGVAWDGDFDRCFFFDENGQFIEGYYLVGLFADYFLQHHPDANIVHDPRLVWNTLEVIDRHHGHAVESKCGHSYIKDQMRLSQALYGGEMSAHHYFKDFYYCDSGMIPVLLMLQILSQSHQPLSVLIEEQMHRYPCSGELNFSVTNPQLILHDIRELLEEDARQVSDIDGLSMEFDDWRFNLRVSNTEPVVRLNIETRAHPELLEEKIHAMRSILAVS